MIYTFSQHIINIFIGVLLFLTSLILFGNLSLNANFIVSNIFILIIVSSIYYFLFKNIEKKNIVNTAFKLGLFLRLLSVIIYYYIFHSITNTPFEITFSDSLYYDEGARLVAQMFRNVSLDLNWMVDQYRTIDKIGYQLFLGIVYYLSYDSILIARFIQAIISAYTIILAYKIGRLVWNEYHGRAVAIIYSGFHPFILYSTLHLREFLLIFLFLVMTYSFLSLVKQYSTNKLLLLIVTTLVMILFRSVYVVIFYAATIAYIAIFERRKIRTIALFTVVFGLLIFIMTSLQIFDTATIKILGYLGLEDNVRLGGYTQERVVSSGMSLAKFIVGPIFILPSIIFPLPSLLELTIERFGQSMHWYFSGGLIIWVFLSIFYFRGMYAAIKLRQKYAIFLFILILLHSFALLESYYFTSIRFNQVKMALVLFFVPSGLQLLRGKSTLWYTLWVIILSVFILTYNYLRIYGRGI